MFLDRLSGGESLLRRKLPGVKYRNYIDLVSRMLNTFTPFEQGRDSFDHRGSLYVYVANRIGSLR